MYQVAFVGVWSDTDLGGIARTRRSTTGGMAALGTHFCEALTVAPPAGQAEFDGIGENGAVVLAMRSCVRVIGIQMVISRGLRPVQQRALSSGVGSRQARRNNTKLYR